jgi:hypothetical protein
MKVHLIPMTRLRLACAVAALLILAVNVASVSAAAGPTVWVPDFHGQQVQVRMGEGPATKSVTLQLPSCTPNSVAVNRGKLLVVCSGAPGDKVLVYDAQVVKLAAHGEVLTTERVSPTQIITSSQFSELIGIALDAGNNVWLASHGNGKIIRIAASSFEVFAPGPPLPPVTLPLIVTVQLVDSPGAPVGLTFDADGSLWATGDYGGGILLNIPANQLSAGAAAQPRFCISAEDSAEGCQHYDGLFKGPEGVAVFNGQVWVANNSTGAGGALPGREVVGLRGDGPTLVVTTTFGSSADPSGPFVCPGGLFASNQYLWVNDQSFAQVNPACGANGDVGSGVGGILRFTRELLADEATDPDAIVRFSNITGRPGFGGLFVEEGT